MATVRHLIQTAGTLDDHQSKEITCLVSNSCV